MDKPEPGSVLDLFVAGFVHKHGRPPTEEEVARRLTVRLSDAEAGQGLYGAAARHADSPTRRDMVLRSIHDYYAAHGVYPSRRDIGDACDMSSSLVNYHLRVLATQGRVKLYPRMARGIVPLEGADGNV